ncbi:MAG: ChbG/HpnK family deacetylase [Bacteroidales bacterium]|nr:ChbG/HpnK family deacetylase [Bacteroidales bacterium]
MRKVIPFIFFVMTAFSISAQNDNTISLLVRADDIGSFHAANVGCIESYQNGIARSVELMPPCAWFPEAVQLLNENPGYDVGIHLTLTSEWSSVKWRPLTLCPSLVDEDGYFFPMVWKNSNFPPGSSISESEWKLDEIEQELRSVSRDGEGMFRRTSVLTNFVKTWKNLRPANTFLWNIRQKIRMK